MSAHFKLVLESDLDRRIDILAKRESLRLWEQAERAEEPADYFWSELVEKCGVLFEFFAAAKTPQVMTMRVWCVLYAVRPDLVGHETIQQAADRFGVSQQALCQQLDRFKEKTGFNYRSRVGMCDSETMRMRVDAMSRARSDKAARFAKRRRDAA